MSYADSPQNRRIAADYAAGIEMRVLCERYGLTRQAIREAARDLGVPPNPVYKRRANARHASTGPRWKRSQTPDFLCYSCGRWVTDVNPDDWCSRCVSEAYERRRAS